MKKYFVIISICCVVAATFFAHQGYAEQCVDVAKGGFSGPGFIAGSGSGTSTEITVRQAALLQNNDQVLMNGSIVHSIGGHRYFFRDSTGDAIISVNQDKWAGSWIKPDDTVEIFGKIKRDKKNQQLFYVDVIHLKKKE